MRTTKTEAIWNGIFGGIKTAVHILYLYDDLILTKYYSKQPFPFHNEKRRGYFFLQICVVLRVNKVTIL